MEVGAEGSRDFFTRFVCVCVCRCERVRVCAGHNGDRFLCAQSPKVPDLDPISRRDPETGGWRTSWGSHPRPNPQTELSVLEGSRISTFFFTLF